jgi:hypothetical protein
LKGQVSSEQGRRRVLRVFPLPTSHFKLPPCETNPIAQRTGRTGSPAATGKACKTNPISGGRNTPLFHHSTIPSFQHSHPTPIVRNEPNFGGRRSEAGDVPCETKPIWRAGTLALPRAIVPNKANWREEAADAEQPGFPPSFGFFRLFRLSPVRLRPKAGPNLAGLCDEDSCETKPIGRGVSSLRFEVASVKQAKPSGKSSESSRFRHPTRLPCEHLPVHRQSLLARHRHAWYSASRPYSRAVGTT